MRIDPVFFSLCHLLSPRCSSAPKTGAGGRRGGVNRLLGRVSVTLEVTLTLRRTARYLRMGR